MDGFALLTTSISPLLLTTYLAVIVGAAVWFVGVRLAN